MPISVQSIVNSMASALDAEGSDRYTFDQDYKPAINYAVRFAVATFNRAFADNKITPESLRELVKVSVWQASQYSRIAYKSSDTGHNLWTLLAIYPNVKTNKAVAGISQGSPEQSFFKADLSYVSGYKDAKRLTFEQWNNTRKNIFVQGNDILKGEMLEYAYLDMADYGSTSYNAGAAEWEIRPDVAKKLVALVYLKSPSEITLITDVLQFPDTMADFISARALNFIAKKQSDGTSEFVVSVKDINDLTSLFS